MFLSISKLFSKLAKIDTNDKDKEVFSKLSSKARMLARMLAKI